MNTSVPLAFCGINCEKCPVFIATNTNNFEPLKDFAARGAKKWGEPESFFMGSKCWGCQQDEKPRMEHCSKCETRSCAKSKGLANCAFCESFDGCAILKEQNNQAIQPSRVNLVKLREEMA